MKKRTKTRGRGTFAAAILLCMIYEIAEAAIPVVTDINIFSGKRGTAVTLKADATLAAELKSANKIATIRIKKAVYGLAKFNFDNLPTGSPIKNIRVKEFKGSEIEIVITMKNDITVPVKTVQKKNQFLALLSAKPAEVFTWNAEKIKKSEEVIEKPVERVSEGNKPSKLNNIRLLERGQISELAFEFNRKVSGTIARKGKHITLTVENAGNGIGKEQIKLPTKGSFSTIHISQSDSAIAISFAIDTSSIDTSLNIAFTQGEVLSVFIAKRNSRKATLWTSGHGLMVDYKFYSVPSYTTDISSIEKKALMDANKKISRNAVFTVKEKKETPKVKPVEVVKTENKIKKEIKKPVPQVAEVKNDTVQKKVAPVENRNEDEIKKNETYPMEVASNGVINMRKYPSLRGKIAGKLKTGDRLDFIEKKNKWVKVIYNGDTGFVYGSLVKKIEEKDVPPIKQSAPVEMVEMKKPDSQNTTGILKVSKTEYKAPENKNETVISQTAALPVIKEKMDLSEMRKRIIKYNGGGRDPFMPIFSDKSPESDLPLAENLALVGVLVDDFDKIALCEDVQNGNKPFTLREHDQVFKGKVLKIYRDKVVFLITEYGISRSYTLSISNKKSSMEASAK